MRKISVLLFAWTLILFFKSWAFADLPPPYFYDVKVTLISGESITGASFGLASFFSGISSQVKTVKLSHAAGRLAADFTFIDKPESAMYERADANASSLELGLVKDYEAIDSSQHKGRYYWIKGQVQIPISNIVQVDTLKVLGSGYALFQDPRVYAKVKEPYLKVHDCALGCSAKLYSQDDSLDKAKLKELWDSRLDCKYRSTSENIIRMRKVMLEYKLKLLVDPLCID